MSKTYRVEVLVRVTDERALIDYADRRTHESWGDSIHNFVLSGDTLVEMALMEALVLSNENPSPDEYGIEILDHRVAEHPGLHLSLFRR